MVLIDSLAAFCWTDSSSARLQFSGLQGIGGPFKDHPRRLDAASKLARNSPVFLTSVIESESEMSTASDLRLIRRNLLKSRRSFQNPAYRLAR